jgi:hypothetical protein
MRRTRGQGLTEYAMLLVGLVLLAIIGATVAGGPSAPPIRSSTPPWASPPMPPPLRRPRNPPTAMPSSPPTPLAIGGSAKRRARRSQSTRRGAGTTAPMSEIRRSALRGC